MICKSVLHSGMLPKCRIYVVCVPALYSGEENKKRTKTVCQFRNSDVKEETFYDWNQNDKVLNEFSGDANSTCFFFVLWSKTKGL